MKNGAPKKKWQPQLFFYFYSSIVRMFQLENFCGVLGEKKIGMRN